MNKTKLLSGIRFLFILLFIYTGASKLMNYDTFFSQLRQSPLLKPMASIFSILIPTIELSIALLLVKKSWRLQGLYACLILMLLFTIYIILLNYSTNYIPCDCGGLLETMPASLHITINILLIFIALSGIYLDKKTRNRDKTVQYKYK